MYMYNNINTIRIKFIIQFQINKICTNETKIPLDCRIYIPSYTGCSSRGEHAWVISLIEEIKCRLNRESSAELNTHNNIQFSKQIHSYSFLSFLKKIDKWPF